MNKEQLSNAKEIIKNIFKLDNVDIFGGAEMLMDIDDNDNHTVNFTDFYECRLANKIVRAYNKNFVLQSIKINEEYKKLNKYEKVIPSRYYSKDVSITSKIDIENNKFHINVEKRKIINNKYTEVVTYNIKISLLDVYNYCNLCKDKDISIIDIIENMYDNSIIYETHKNNSGESIYADGCYITTLMRTHFGGKIMDVVNGYTVEYDQYDCGDISYQYDIEENRMEIYRDSTLEETIKITNKDGYVLNEHHSSKNDNYVYYTLYKGNKIPKIEPDFERYIFDKNGNLKFFLKSNKNKNIMIDYDYESSETALAINTFNDNELNLSSYTYILKGIIPEAVKNITEFSEYYKSIM